MEYENFDVIYWQWHQWKYELEIKLFLQDNQQNGENFRITLPFGHVAVLLKDQQLIQTLLKSQPDYKYWISKTVDIETNLEKELLTGEDSWLLDANILHFASRFFPEALHSILSFFDGEGNKVKLINETHREGMYSPLHCSAIQPESIGTRLVSSVLGSKR